MARRPKLGQHFLHDRNVLAKIAAALPLGPEAHVVEIGPGQGALTEHLLATGARVTAVEVDTGLEAGLREKFGDNPRFELVMSDVLHADLGALLGEGPGYVAGNLPYYITSPIVRRVLALGAQVEQAVFLVQKEVAERIAARKGSRDYGYLSALCRLYSEPKCLFTVKPGAFRPPPKVDSAVVLLTIRKEPLAPPKFEKFLEAAFRQPRKTLLNNLSALYDKTAIAERPEMKLRAQQLDVEELAELWRAL